MNSDRMDVDPLSSYQHYSYHLFHPPSIPQSNHTLPSNPTSLPINPTPLPNNPTPLPINPTPLPNNTPPLPVNPTPLPINPTPIPVNPTPLPNTPNIQTLPNLHHPTYPYSNNYPPIPYPMPSLNYQTMDQIVKPMEQHYPTEETNDQTPDIQEEEDIKPDITKIKIKKSRKVKGKTSSYWNKKISDKEFKFYGCSVCNISFRELHELDSHVTIHSNRVTTYDVRIQNKKKKKRLKKEMKKKKKIAKVKTEPEFEIKPEDGYIGTEKAGDQNAVEAGQKSEKCDGSRKGDSQKDGTSQKSDDSQKGAGQNGDSGINGMKNGYKKPGKVVVNNKDAVYKCFACNKQFALSYYLKIHVRSHTDEKPYLCNYCGQTFITASKRSRHVKRIHLTLRHQCRICFKFFNRFELLTKHFDQKHEDQKLEGEPYDYNAILPYLTDLEDQFKLEGDKKPKTEDLWGDVGATAPTEATAPTAPTESTVTTETFVLEGKVEIEEDTKPPKFEIEQVEVKCEASSSEESDEEVIDETFEHQDSDDEPLAKERQRPIPPNTHISEIEQIKVQCEAFDVEITDEISEQQDFADERQGSNSPNTHISEIEEVKVKCEAFDGDFTDVIFEQQDFDDDERTKFIVTLEATEASNDANEHDSSDEVKQERLPPTDDEEEYFPPGGCARSPPADIPAPLTPLRRKGGVGACELCNRTFSSTSYLKVHMRTHTGEKPFSCYVCKRGFITASKMHRHVLTHDETWVGENKIKPEGAEIKSENEDDDVDNKIKKENSKIENAKDKLLRKPNKRMDPKLKKNRRRPHCCEYCDKKFMHIETLQVHKKSHDGEILIYKCTYCLEPQLDQVAKAEHEVTHTGPKPYLCTLCGRQYNKKGALLYHRKNHKAQDEKQFICDICSKRFDSQAKLARHIPTHSTEKFVLRYECPVCANMFNTRWHIQMHLKSHQKEGLILEENRNAVLAMVMQNARKIPKGPLDPSHRPPPPAPDPDERSRICNICGQVFQHFYYLEEHLKTHGNKIAVNDLEEEEEKKYTCQVCSKSFKLHYYLKLHSFTHTKEKPFICQQCGKGFITKGKLKRHLETHQGLKKYQCHICYKFFTRPSYMRIHVRTIHGTQDYNFRDYGTEPVPLVMPMSDICSLTR